MVGVKRRGLLWRGRSVVMRELGVLCLERSLGVGGWRGKISGCLVVGNRSGFFCRWMEGGWW